MPTVTRIQKQKRGERVNIYLDDKFAFGLDLDNFVKFGIKVDQELTPQEVKKIKSSGDFAKLYGHVVRFAMLRPRSKKEIADWFYRKKVSETTQKKLLQKLKKLDLLDDEKFAIWWIEQRTSFRPRGKRALTSELRQKGIDSSVIVRVLATADLDERVLAKALLEKNAYKWARVKDQQNKKRKIVGFLQRKGFGWSTIKDLL